MASLTDSCRPPTYSVVFGLLPLPLTVTVVLCMPGEPPARWECEGGPPRQPGVDGSGTSWL